MAALMSGAVGACNASTAASSAALSRFGFSLFANLCHANPAHNVVLSPLVVAGALSMAVAGATAGGKTEQELLGLLGLSTHADFAVLTSAVLASSGASVSAANGIFTRAAVRPDFGDGADGGTDWALSIYFCDTEKGFVMSANGKI